MSATNLEKEVELIDSAIEMSIIVGYMGANVHPSKIEIWDRLIKEHCVFGLAVLERGDVQNHLHFQVVVCA